jgi:hypothetical protein
LLIAAQAAFPAGPAPSVTIRGPGATEEGGVAVFSVRLSRAAPRRVVLRYATEAGTASAASDYSSRRGTLAFARGQRTKTIRVTIKEDSDPEAAESFAVVLSRASGARIRGRRASVVIPKNDLPTFTLTATMDGAQEAATAGGRGDPTARGTASFLFDAAAEAVTYTITISAATTPFVVGHIHPGRPPDLRGVVTQFEGLPAGNGTSSSSARLPLAAILEVYRNPSGYWVQLHKDSPDPTVGTIGGPLSLVP